MSGVVKKQDTKTSLTFSLFYAGRGGAAAPFAGVRLRAEEKEEREEEERPSGKGALSTWPPCASAPDQRYPSVTARGEGDGRARLSSTPLDAANSHEDFLTRLRLGEGLQAHVETRLVSWSHVSDSSVSTLLRDYPLASRPAAAGDVPARAPSALLLLDIPVARRRPSCRRRRHRP